MAKKRYGRRYDGTLSPDELKEAIEQYKAQKQGGGKDEEVKQAPKAAPAEAEENEDEEPEMIDAEKTPEDILSFVKGRRDRRDEAGDPCDEDEAMGMIAQMDEDIGFLCDALDELLAQRDMEQEGIPETEEDEDDTDTEVLPKTLAKPPVRRPMPQLDDDEEEVIDEEPNDELEALRKQLDGKDEDVKVLFDIIDTLLAKDDMNNNTDGDDEGIEDEDESLGELNTDEDDDLDFEDEEEEEDDEDVDFDEDDDFDFEDEEEEEDVNEDEDDSNIPFRGKMASSMNADSVDALVRERVRIGMIGKQLNMDGLERMNAKMAKKKIIKKVRPSINLDGKSNAYINAAFDCACNDVDAMTRKGTAYQKKQMFNSKKTSRADSREYSSAEAARARMLKRLSKNNY